MLSRVNRMVSGSNVIRVAFKHDDVNDHLHKLDARDVQFNPNRSRDVYDNAVTETSEHTTSQTSKDETGHLEAYSHQAAISLNAVMQSNVPEPFSTQGKAPTHLNMPGGGWSKDYKYLSNQLQQTHYSKQSSGDKS